MSSTKKRSYRKKEYSSDDEKSRETKSNIPSKLAALEGVTLEQDDGDVSETLEELIELRKFRKRPQGIDVEKLSKGDKRKRKKDDDPWKLTTGGLIDKDAIKGAKEEDEESGKQKIMLDSFTKQTNALDVDKHMMAYIEEEMRKRRGQTLASRREELEIKPPNPEDELFQPPDHLRIESKPISEGNVQLSTTMLTAIPEVDLGIDVRLKNIEETEKAKRKLLEQRNQKPSEDKDAFVGSNFSATNRFYRSRPNTGDPERSTQQEQPNQQNKSGSSGHRREMATDDIVAERFKKRLRR